MEIVALTREELLARSIKSSDALRLKIDNTVNPPVLANNILYLYDKVVLPLEKHFGTRMLYSSWYRCKKLNTAVGGAASSFHLYGAAVDLDMDGTKVTNKEIFEYIKANLPYSELINEYDFSWVHVALVKGRDNEKVIKRIYNKGGKKVTEIVK